MDYTLFRLPNGLRVVYHYFEHSSISHLGLVANVGTRHEAEGEMGMAHFLEHMLFKGTKTRKAYHVLTRLDAVGGEVNAYTTKETTSVYAVFMHEHFERAAELLKNIVFESVFPEKELEKEKKVVIDELHSYEDSPEEGVYDGFEDLVFEHHPLGKNILGTEQSLSSFDRQKVVAFYERHYMPENVVLSYVGNLGFKEFERAVNRYFAPLAPAHAPTHEPQPHSYHARHSSLTRPTTQLYQCLGSPAPHLHSTQRVATQLLNSILGGEGMNCRLNLHIREKYGYVYAIDSCYVPYQDTGLLCISHSTDPKYNPKVNHLIQKELQKLRHTPLTTTQLHQAKQQYCTRVAMSEESRTSLMLGMAKSIINFGRIDSLPQYFAQIHAITAAELMELANQIFQPEHQSSLSYNPQ